MNNTVKEIISFHDEGKREKMLDKIANYFENPFKALKLLKDKKYSKIINIEPNLVRFSKLNQSAYEKRVRYKTPHSLRILERELNLSLNDNPLYFKNEFQIPAKGHKCSSLEQIERDSSSSGKIGYGIWPIN